MRFAIKLVLVGAVVVGLGIYRGWFHFASDSAAGTSNVTLTVDKNKMQEDKNIVVGNVKDLGNHVEGTAAAIDKGIHPTTQSATH